MAEDAAIMECKSEGTLRLYTWNPKAVSIGYFQAIDEVVDLNFCIENNINVVRRMTGGGAVFHDKELTYSMIWPMNDWIELAGRGGKDVNSIMDTYRIICACVIAGLGELGISATFKPINDIETNGKKISGNAQTKRNGCLLQHGTILYGLGGDVMFRAIRICEEKISDKKIESPSQRVTCVTSEAEGVSFEDLTGAIKNGFERVLGEKLEHGELNEEERSAKDRLRGEIFTKEWWNHQR